MTPSKSMATCTCGRNFKTDDALQQHQRDSPLHSKINTVKGKNGGECSSGKTVRDKNVLKEHTRDSPHHNKLKDLRGKGKIPESQQFANFRNEEIFPPFLDLPSDDDINLTFYNTENGFNYRPQKHWCFLAEIIDVERFLRVKLMVRDTEDTMLPVAFYTDGRGNEFAPSQLRPGYTIAILYARQHGFLDFTTGIRQEEYSTVKVIPLALAELLQLSDRVHQYAVEVDGKRTCHGCDEKKTSLQKCSKCSLFSYCNKSCQSAGWNERGHKLDCKLIRDSDLQAMFLLNWGCFEDFIRFPLHKTISTRGQGKMRDIDSWKRQVEKEFQSKPATEKEVISGEVDEVDLATCSYDYPAGDGLEASRKAEEVQPSNRHIDSSFGENGEYTKESLSISKFVENIDFAFATEAEQMHQLEGLKAGPLEKEAQGGECKLNNSDQKNNERERTQKYIERQREADREKAPVRAKQAMLKLANFTKPSSGSAESSSGNQTKQGSQEVGTADDSALIRRCLRSAIPSIAATTGADILELVNLDILNGHLGLNIDLSDAWQRLLKPEVISENIETFLGECATDPYAWSVLRREGHFKLKLWGVVRAFDQDKNQNNKNREFLIHVLETLREILESVEEWEIVPDHVPRAVMRMAIAVAKEGPDPPGIDLGDKDLQIDPFLALVADKSESSLFGTPDSDNPRYWDYWIRRDGFGSTSS